MSEATGAVSGENETVGAAAAAALAAKVDAMFAGMDAPARALRRAVSALGGVADALNDAEAAAEVAEATGAAGKARQRLSGVMQMADEVAQRLDHVRIAEERIEELEPPVRAVVQHVLARQLLGVAEDIRDRRDENAATLAELDASLERIAKAAPDAPVGEARKAAHEMEAATLAPMEAAIAALNATADATAAVTADGLEDASADAMPDWLEPLYTMQEERRLHTAALAELADGDRREDSDIAGAEEPERPRPSAREAALAVLSERLPKAESPAGFRLALGSVLLGLVGLSTLIAVGRGGAPTWPGLGIFLIAHALATFGAASMLFRTGNERLSQLRDDMERLAFRDSLTGLMNRRGLTRVLGSWLRPGGEASARAPRSVAVLHIDLDHFKAVNDTLGHDAGDHVLSVAAERMVACLGTPPAGRTEHDDAAVCRTGGDEFCVVLADDVAAKAEEVAGAIVAETAKTIDFEGNACQIGASIGIAYGGGADGSRNPERLLSDADLATYVAKEEGRGRFAIFDPALRAEQEAEAQLAGALIRALSGQATESEGRIEIWFQPCIAMPAGEVVAAEALVRWRHAELGDVPPERLLAAAERNGVGERLSAEITRLVVDAVSAWREAGITVPLVTLNLGATELRSRDLPKRLEASMTSAGLAPGQFGVEAAEASATGRGAVLAQETLSTLRRAGAPVIVDRFGRDAVALSTISAMSATAVKLDRGLVGQLGEDAEGMTLLKGLVTLARSLSFTVVATGVETRAQLDLLRAAGCDALQGFAVARPEPAESFAAWLSFADVVPAEQSPLALPATRGGYEAKAEAS